MVKIYQGVSLKPFTSFRVGGRAQYFTKVETLPALRQALTFAKQRNLPCWFLGGGTNVLISDSVLLGLVVLIVNQSLSFAGSRVKIGAGFKLDRLVSLSLHKGLRGLESLSGIPGTVGGAVFGNAGAWGKSLSDFVVGVKVFENNKVKTYSDKQCAFAYRNSIFSRDKKQAVIWEIELNLERSAPRPLLNQRQAVLAYRAVRYPAANKSAGSFFKNVPANQFSPEVLQGFPNYAFSRQEVASGYLIEKVGLLGKRMGGARIAAHQGNYLLNTGKAQAQDVLALAQLAQGEVFEKYRVLLEPEIQLWGFENGLKTNQ